MKPFARIFALFLLFFTLTATLASAQTAPRRGMSRKAKGAIIGGGTGAVVGGLIGGGKGAVIGAAAGAVGGGAIGRKQDRRRDPARYNNYRNR